MRGLGARGLGLGALVAIGLLSCKRGPRACAENLLAVLEIRDGAGAIELTLRTPPGAPPGPVLDLCDAADRRVGALRDEGDGLALVNAAGDPQARLAARAGDDPILTLTTPEGPRDLRLHDQGGLLRILDPIGVPIAQIGLQEGRTLTFDAAGTPRASASSEGGRRLIKARDGAVTRYAVGLATDRAAAALAVDRLGLSERVALARFLDRREARK